MLWIPEQSYACMHKCTAAGSRASSYISHHFAAIVDNDEVMEMGMNNINDEESQFTLLIKPSEVLDCSFRMGHWRGNTQEPSSRYANNQLSSLGKKECCTF